MGQCEIGGELRLKEGLIGVGVGVGVELDVSFLLACITFGCIIKRRLILGWMYYCSCY